jgi:hypothetical protein
MRHIGIVIVALTLAGCETPSSVQQVSDYEICRLSILRPPLQSTAAINEADRQIRTRGVNCSAYSENILQEQQQGLQQMQQGLQMMQQGSTTQQQQQNKTRPRQPTISCSKMGDKSRAVYTFNANACPIGYAPSY